MVQGKLITQGIDTYVKQYFTLHLSYWHLSKPILEFASEQSLSTLEVEFFLKSMKIIQKVSNSICKLK